MDNVHALVLEGFLYGTEVNITCLKQPRLFAAPLMKVLKNDEWQTIKTWVKSDLNVPVWLHITNYWPNKCVNLIN